MKETVMTDQRNPMIPQRFIPEKGAHTETVEGRAYLIANDAMYTFYRRTKGEFSRFFLALKDEKKVLGCRCSRCSIVRVPPFLTHCPDCEFAPTELGEVSQVGIMNSTPPITYFATALFQHMAPYGRGRVILSGADTAMSVNLYTTTGILVPGIFKKGTEVKLVFRDKRVGIMTDIFGVPASELTKEQLEKPGLQESEIDWEKPVEPQLPEGTDTDLAVFSESLREVRSIVGEMNTNARAKKDIAGWKRNIHVKTRSGEFSLIIDDGDVRVEDRVDGTSDFVMVCDDLRVLVDGLFYRGALTDSIINKKLWISKNMEFNTIFKLDRMARSVARSRKR
jgi:uncharacterized OB-fold protein/putative sterol carrier protein